MNPLEKRVIEISFKNKLSHIGSCLCTVNTLDQIYKIRKKDEPIILSNGHAGLALYVVLEKYGYGNAEELWRQHGTNPNRDLEDGIYASTGSLGHGIGIAVGMALVNPNRLVYVLMSDGECAEGSVWEALRIARDNKLENLRVAVIANGFSAYDRVDIDDLDTRIVNFYPTMVIKTHLFSLPDFMQGLNGHYCVLDQQRYEEIMKT